MREIKFRAWDVISKHMWQWGEIFDIPAWEIFPGTPEQRPWEVMQYTGLKDMNGKEIYEGDILHVVDVSTTGTLEYDSPVQWIDYGWIVTEPPDTYVPLVCLDTSHDWIGTLSEIEVIGNIYENADLLANTVSEKEVTPGTALSSEQP